MAAYYVSPVVANTQSYQEGFKDTNLAGTLGSDPGQFDCVRLSKDSVR